MHTQCTDSTLAGPECILKIQLPMNDDVMRLDTLLYTLFYTLFYTLAAAAIAVG